MLGLQVTDDDVDHDITITCQMWVLFSFSRWICLVVGGKRVILSITIPVSTVACDGYWNFVYMGGYDTVDDSIQSLFMIFP